MKKSKVRVIRLTALAVALGSALPVFAAGASNDAPEKVSTGASLVLANISWESPRHGDMTTAALQTEKAATQAITPLEIETSGKIGTTNSDMAPVPNGGNPQLLIKKGALNEGFKMAQFQLPGGSRDAGEGPSQREARRPELLSDLKFGYAYGSDSELTYLKNRDLNSSVRDNFTGFNPTVFGFVDYRPNNWLATKLEVTLEVPLVLREEKVVVLPDGSVQFQRKSKPSLLIDQAYATFKNLAGPFDFTIGRRNFEDGRLWLYDGALDAFIVNHKLGDFHTEASVSRENLVDADLLVNVPKGKINNYMLYTEYRGIEDHKLAGYVIKRADKAKLEGDPVLTGVRAYGRPTDRFNYWAELGFARGKDNLKQKLDGYAYDVGGTYRFPGLPLQPALTLGYAFGSGDDNPNDTRNKQFRQTGLQSNEGRFGGFTQFKAYGETLDPELSNIKILTAGIGFRMAPTAYVDIVYHRYKLVKIASEFRSSGVTAQMNQVDTHLSKKVGDEIDIVLGFRNLFGYRRLGFEVRGGWFRPGNAFLRNVGTDEEPVIRKADKAISVLAVIIW